MPLQRSSAVRQTTMRNIQYEAMLTCQGLHGGTYPLL